MGDRARETDGRADGASTEIDREGDEDAQGRDKMRNKSVEKRSMHHHHHHRDNASKTLTKVDEWQAARATCGETSSVSESNPKYPNGPVIGQ